MAANFQGITASTREALTRQGILHHDHISFVAISVRSEEADGSLLNIIVSIPDAELAEQYFRKRTLKFTLASPYDHEQIESEVAKAWRTLQRRMALYTGQGVFERQKKENRPVLPGQTKPKIANVEVKSKRKRKRRRKKHPRTGSGGGSSAPTGGDGQKDGS